MAAGARARRPASASTLTVDDYVAIEGLSGALNAHANQIFDDLGKQRAQVAEWVFRALTAGSTIADAVRRPTRLDELIAACGGDEAGVRAVVDAFRAPGVNFLVPEFDPHNPKLAPDTYIDISHESLIRQWKKLSEWLGAEGRAAQQWRRLVDRFGTGEMLRGRELANLIAWRAETKPNAAWAKRYGGDYPAVIAYPRQEPARAEHQARRGDRLHRRGLRAGGGLRNRRDPAAHHHQPGKAPSCKRAKLARTAGRTRSAHEPTTKQVLDLLENVIFDIALPLTSSDRSTPQTPRSASRASDTRADRRRATAPTGPASGTQRPRRSRAAGSGDRTTHRRRNAPEPGADHRRPSPSRRRGGWRKSDPDDIELQRLCVVSLTCRRGQAAGQGHSTAPNRRSTKASRSLRDDAARPSPTDRSLWKDELALALVGLARVKIRRDDHASARAVSSKEAIAVEREFAEGRPTDRLLNNLQIHLGELGDTLRQARRPQRSAQGFRRAAADPPPAADARCPATRSADRRIGRARPRRPTDARQGDLNGSRKYFEEALKIDRELYQALDPTRRDWQENLVFSLSRIGDLDRQLGRQREALTPYEEALELQRKLASDSTVIAPQQTLASLLGKIGDIKRRLKDFPAAISAHREELEIRRRLLAREPNSLAAQAQRFQRARLSRQHVARKQGPRRAPAPPSTSSSSSTARSPRPTPTTSRASPTWPGA